MGRQFASDLADSDYGLSLENSIAIHLQGNHYPPVPLSMVAVCIKAIESFNEHLNGDELIELPKGSNPVYIVANVKSWTGPWVSYVKLVDTRTNVYYKIDQGVPSPFFLFENKLYIPDRYGVFTSVKDYSTLEFTCYTLKE